MEVIEINEKNQSVIFDIFDLAFDEEGFVVDKLSKQRIICKYSDQPIKKETLAIVGGSELEINNFSFCLSEYLTEYLNDK